MKIKNKGNFLLLSYLIVLLSVLILSSNCQIFEEDEIYKETGDIIPGKSLFPPDYAEDGDYIPNSLVVKVAKGFTPDIVATLVNGKVNNSFKIESSEYAEILLPDSLSVEDALATVNGRPSIIYAEPNYLYKPFFVPNDSFYTTNQWGPQLTDCPKAWDLEQGKPYVTLTVIDTGIDFHQEFQGRMIKGWDFINKVPTAPYQSIDDNGHGTHVAGISAAGGNNTVGMAGVAWNVKVKPLKVCGSRGCPSYSITDAVRFAADEQGDNRVVVNMSLGGAFPSSIAADANAYAHKKDVVVVCATGNDGKYNIQFPASYTGNIGVGCTTAEDKLVYFSSRGQAVSVCAPGADIISCASDTWDKYMTISGTSMASPFVAGYAALILSANPYLKPAEVKEIIEMTADPLEDQKRFTWSPDHGWGRVNVGNGIELAVNLRKSIRPLEADILGLESTTDAISPDLINWSVVRALWDRLEKDEDEWSYDIPLKDEDGNPILDEYGVQQTKTVKVDKRDWTWTDKNGQVYTLGENSRSDGKLGFRYGSIKAKLYFDGNKVVNGTGENIPITDQIVMLMNTTMDMEYRTQRTSDGYSVVTEEGGAIPPGEVNFFNIPEGEYILRAVIDDNNDIYKKVTVTPGTNSEVEIIVSPAYSMASYYISSFPIYNSNRVLGNPQDLESPALLYHYLIVVQENDDTSVAAWGRYICFAAANNGNYFGSRCNCVLPMGKRYFVVLVTPIWDNDSLARYDWSVNYYGLHISTRNKVFEYYKMPELVNNSTIGTEFPELNLINGLTPEMNGKIFNFVDRFDSKKNLSMEPQKTWWLDEQGDFYDVKTESWVDLNRNALTSPDEIKTDRIYTGFLTKKDQDTWVLDLTGTDQIE